MQATFPPDRSLGEPERLRLFAKDAPLVEIAKQKAGLDDDEIKRRAIHVGLPVLLEMLGIDPPKKKAA